MREFANDWREIRKKNLKDCFILNHARETGKREKRERGPEIKKVE